MTLKSDKFMETARWLVGCKGQLHDNELALKHLKVFLKYFVVTKDEHDVENPFKRLPYDRFPHLALMAEVYIYENLICVAKSRQIMMTWLFCSILLWDAMFKKGRLNIVINKKEKDADKTIERCRIIYKNLPQIIRNSIVASKTPQGKLGAFCELTFPENSSEIVGLPQNPDAARMNTASNIFIDEAAFLESAEECYTAALPAIRGGHAKMIINSTPKGQNFFCRVHNDLGDEL